MSLRELWQCCSAERVGGDLKGVVVRAPPNDIHRLICQEVHFVGKLNGLTTAAAGMQS